MFVWEHYWDIHAWTAGDASWTFFLLWKVWYFALMYVVVSIFPELNMYSSDGHRGYTRVSKSADQGHQIWHLLSSYILWWYSISVVHVTVPNLLEHLIFPGLTFLQDHVGKCTWYVWSHPGWKLPLWESRTPTVMHTSCFMDLYQLNFGCEDRHHVCPNLMQLWTKVFFVQLHGWLWRYTWACWDCASTRYLAAACEHVISIQSLLKVFL